MSDFYPEPPPLDYEALALPSFDDPFYESDDPFQDQFFVDFDYQPRDDPGFSTDELRQVELDSASGFGPDSRTIDPQDPEWNWHDARLIGVEREEGENVRFEIGAVDVFANPTSGELAANYLPIADFGDIDVAAAYYHNLQQQIHDQNIPIHELSEFAEQQAGILNSEVEAVAQWRAASPEEYAAYTQLRMPEISGLAGMDEPVEPVIENLLSTVSELGGSDVEAPPFEDASTFQALSAIGLAADEFDPAKDPPPFYDPTTGTAYWIGVFQPDPADRDNCVTSILSLGRDAETGDMQAQLAPCIQGDWDTAYQAAEQLIELAHKGDIERVFDAAEDMALSANQYQLWDSGRGVGLEPETTDAIAAYSRETWDLEL